MALQRVDSMKNAFNVMFIPSFPSKLLSSWLEHFATKSNHVLDPISCYIFRQHLTHINWPTNIMQIEILFWSSQAMKFEIVFKRVILVKLIVTNPYNLWSKHLAKDSNWFDQNANRKFAVFLFYFAQSIQKVFPT